MVDGIGKACMKRGEAEMTHLGSRNSDGAPEMVGSSTGTCKRRSLMAVLPTSRCCSTDAALGRFEQGERVRTLKK